MYSIRKHASLFIAIVFLISGILQGCAKQTTDITPSTLPTGATGTVASGVNLIPYDKNTTINTIQSPWKLVGPGGGGAIFVPTVSITDPKTAMVASDMTGTFITHDGGMQWKEVNLRSRVDAIAFDPIDSKTIYASSTGLFKSTDNGDSWKLIYPSPDSGISEKMVGDHAEHSFIAKDNWPGGTTQIIYIDPQQPNNIYLGMKTSTLDIYYSVDKGVSWKKGPQISGANFIKMYIDSNSPAANRDIYLFSNTGLFKMNSSTMSPVQITLPARINSINSVACGINPTTKKAIFYLTTPARWSNGTYLSGVMKSIDNGSTWVEMQTGLNKDLPASSSGNTRQFTSIATALSDARVVYVAVERASGVLGDAYLGMFKSGDEGSTWDWALKIGDKYPANLTGGWLERSYDTEWNGAPKLLAVCPNEPDTLYYTGIGMAFNTIDGGKTWNQIYSKDNPDGTSSSNGLEVTTCYGVHFDPFDKNHMVISYTDIGLSQSFNGGASMSHAINGVPEEWKNTCYWMVFDPAVKGRAWSVWASGHDLPREKMFRAGSLVDRFVGGVCKSDDGIKSWQKASDGLPSNTVATHIILDPKSPVGNRTLYIAACGKGVYKSIDDGNTWVLKSNGISIDNLNAWRLVQTPDGTQYLLVIRGLVGTTQIDGALYKSNDGAENWEKVILPNGVNGPNDMISDPSNSQHMYLACWPKKVNDLSQSGGLYETNDGGKTWTNIFDNTSHVYSVAIDPNTSSTLYIVTFEGAAYRSDDSGKTWNLIKGFDFKWGHRPVPDPYNKDMLYITTFGSSVWYGPAR